MQSQSAQHQETPHLRIFNGTEETQGELAVPELEAGCSLETVLTAWHEATVRLEQTHEILQSEVRRLNEELERKNKELALNARLADLGRMASHVAHEVRNSLVPVTLYVELLKRRLLENPGSLEILTKIEAGFTALDVTVNDLLNFTSHREPRWASFLATELIQEVCDALKPQLDAQSIQVLVEVEQSAQLTADREMLRRAVLNLALNALDAMANGGELVITAFEGPHGFMLEVADSGNGVNHNQLEKVFEPFFTTKSNGTGLGLAIVQRIAEAHGGRITAMNCPEGGAAFTIELPARQQLKRMAA
ncbi:sensor histidine kinase [Bythopirellula polymerisocia]|uniref:histidine kinase n=1 Tax=Bythopirellula polymerisocia TaxID=2528003 RepID=A0A5C6CS73_9BACT|nr:ATP-binding protein [Bythopirellula polymerisocia]TWU27793.1 Sensor protein ZraS [Bythopirellula polymerisocia]